MSVTDVNDVNGTEAIIRLGTDAEADDAGARERPGPRRPGGRSHGVRPSPALSGLRLQRTILALVDAAAVNLLHSWRR